MTTWIAGTVGDWFDASNWTGGVVPQSGDTAIIGGGEPQISSANPISGEQIILGGSSNASSVTLDATDAVFSNDTIAVSSGGPLSASFLIAGATSFSGEIDVQAPAGTLAIDLNSAASDFTLTGPGTLIAVSRESVLELSGQGTFTNDAAIAVNGLADIAQDLTVAGAGSFILQVGGKLSVEGSVGADQTVEFDDGTGLLTLADAASFLGKIDLTLPGASIDLTNIDAQSESYDSNQHTLTLYAGPNQTGAVLAQLDVHGKNSALQTDDFTLSHPHGTDSLISFTPGGVTVSAQPMPVPVVAAPGTMVPLADILQQSFGTAQPGFYGMTLLQAPSFIAPVNASNIGYWGATYAAPTWYLDGVALSQDTPITMDQIGDVALQVGNSMQPIEIEMQVTPDAGGGNAKFVDYDIFTIDPAVAALLAGTPTPAGEVASAEAYNAVFGAIRNSDYCYVIAADVAAANGAPLATQWDYSLEAALNIPGGFWRVVYNGSQVPNPVSNWSTLVEPGDIVGMDWSSTSGHDTTVIAGGGPGNPVTTPITVYDNIYYPPGHPDRESIGFHLSNDAPGNYWEQSEPDSIVIWRLDPKQQYLIQGWNRDEFIQGSVYNNLIEPGGGGDTITAGLGNNEIEDTTANLDGITVTDFHLGDTFDFTDLDPAQVTASYAGGAMHVFNNGSEVAAITMPGPSAGQSFEVGSDGNGGSLIVFTVAQELTQTQFSTSLGANIDAATHGSILTYLHNAGFYNNNGDTAGVQQGTAPSVDPFADVAEFSATSFTPITTATDLSAIVATGLNVHVTLQGSVGVLLASGNGNDVLDLTDVGDDSVLAGAGNDTVDAGQGQDTVRGGDGNDLITVGRNGFATGDQAFGEAGNDTMVDVTPGTFAVLGVNAGANTLDGGAGDDALLGAGGGTAVFSGGDGSDRFAGTGSGTYTFDGGDGNDTASLQGAGDETALGGAGNDSLFGSGGGSYSLDGGAGRDFVYGIGGGAESLAGGDDTDTLLGAAASGYAFDGGNGNDLIYPLGSGAQTVTGGSGDDVIAALGSGSYSIDGGAGNDSIYATGSGSDTIAGGDGDDFITTGRGTEQIDGGDGNDRIFFSANSGQNDSLDGGTGNDTVVFQGKLQSNITNESTAIGVTTLVFDAASGGQTVFVQNVETLLFADGSQQQLGLLGAHR